MTFPLPFIIWSKKQRWPKIQFYLLEHIFSTKFVHFPIDISEIFFEEFHQSSLWIKQKFRRILRTAWIWGHKTMKIPLPMLLWVIPYDWETKYTKKKLNFKKKIWGGGLFLAVFAWSWATVRRRGHSLTACNTVRGQFTKMLSLVHIHVRCDWVLIWLGGIFFFLGGGSKKFFWKSLEISWNEKNF